MGRTLALIVLLITAGSIRAQSTDTTRLKITPLTGDFYVYETYSMYKGNRIGANGMYLVTDKGAVLFDTPWDTTQFQPLADVIKSRHGKGIIMCVATHFHEDRTAGLTYFSKMGAKTYTTRRTDELSRQHGMQRARYLVNNDTTFTVGQYSFQLYYPGHGHAPDNIVLWFEKEKILYGGCLVKSVMDTSLGNLGDASISAYPKTIKNVQRRFRNPMFIITGHNDWRSIRSLKHTLRMAKQLRKKIEQ